MLIFLVFELFCLLQAFSLFGRDKDNKSVENSDPRRKNTSKPHYSRNKSPNKIKDKFKNMIKNKNKSPKQDNNTKSSIKSADLSKNPHNSPDNKVDSAKKTFSLKNGLKLPEVDVGDKRPTDLITHFDPDMSSEENATLEENATPEDIRIKNMLKRPLYEQPFFQHFFKDGRMLSDLNKLAIFGQNLRNVHRQIVDSFRPSE